MNTELKIETKLVTPEYANYLLSLNTNNRAVDISRVRQYAAQMQKGLWKLNGDTIRVSKSGIILDSQHRLMAIVMSEVSLPCIIIWGLDDDVFDTIDSGKMRTAADVLKLSGVTNSTTVASIIRSYLLLMKDVTGRGTTGSGHVTNQDILTELNKREEYWNDTANLAQRLYGRMGVIVKSNYGSYFAYFNEFHNYDTVVNFFDALTLQNNTGIIAIDLLRNAMIKNMTSTKKMTRTYITAYFIKVFNAYVTSNDLRVLKYNPDVEKFPTIVKFKNNFK